MSTSKMWSWRFLDLSPAGKTRKHVARNIYCEHIFPRCFPVLPHGKHCFRKQNCFLRDTETYFAARNSVSHVAKLGTSRKHVSAAHVSGNMFPRFASLRALVTWVNIHWTEFLTQKQVNEWSLYSSVNVLSHRDLLGTPKQ